MGLGFSRHECRFLSVAAWDAFYRVAEMDALDEYRMRYNATRSAYHGRDDASLIANLNAREDALLFNRELDELALAEAIADASHGQSVGSLPSAASHFGVGIGVATSDSELDALPPHLAGAIRRQQAAARAAEGGAVSPPAAPSDALNAEIG